MSFYDEYKKRQGAFAPKAASPPPTPEKPSPSILRRITDFIGTTKPESLPPTPPAPTAQANEKPASGSFYDQYKAKQGAFGSKTTPPGPGSGLPVGTSVQPQKPQGEPARNETTTPLAPGIKSGIPKLDYTPDTKSRATISAPEQKGVFDAAYDKIKNILLDPLGTASTEQKVRAMDAYATYRIANEKNYTALGEQIVAKDPEFAKEIGIDAIPKVISKEARDKAISNAVYMNRDKVSQKYGIDAEAISFDKVLENPNKVKDALGLERAPTNLEMAGKLFTIPVVAGLVTNPVTTVVAIAGFEALSGIERKIGKAVVGDKFENLSDALPNEASQMTRDFVDALDLIAKGFVLHGFYKKAPGLAQTFTKQTIETYNLPKTVFIEAGKIKSIFQTGEKISPAELKLVQELGLSGAEYKQAIKDGLTIEVPAEKVVTVADKPYWARLKQAIGLKPVDPTTVVSYAGEVKQGPAGLLPEGKPGEAVRPAPEVAPELKPAAEGTPSAIGEKYTPGSQKVVEAFDKSKDQKAIGENSGVSFELGSFGESHAVRKAEEGKFDRFPADELSKTVENITGAFRASDNATKYRYDNIAWLAKMPDGETRAIYTRQNKNGAEEIISWHKIKEVNADKYTASLESFGAPDRTRTGTFNLENQSPIQLGDGGISSKADTAKEVKVPRGIEKEVEIARQNIESQKQIRIPEAVQDMVIYRTPEGEKKVVARDTFEGTKQGGIFPAEKTESGATILGIVKADGTFESPKSALSQKEKVAEVVKEGPKSIKEISKETKILEPNVRRILGVGAKEGTFERVDKGVYVLKYGDKQTAYVEIGDSKEVLARMAKNKEQIFDSVILDPVYFSRALVGGNRGIKAWEFIKPEDFADVMKSISQLVATDDAHVYLMLSGARTAQPDMMKYVRGATDAGFIPVGEGSYTKLTKEGKPVTNVRGLEAAPERLILLTKSGKARAGEIPANLHFRFVRPSIAKSYATEKPAELMNALIRQSTLEGEKVLDPFAGSGVTGAEALKSGRSSTLIEKSEKAVEEHIKPRLEKAAGGGIPKATREYPTIHQGGELKMVQGEPVKIVDGVETFLHKGDGGWIVSEASTGRFISESRTKDGAIAKAESNIENVGKDKFLQLLEKHKLQATAKSGALGFNPKNLEEPSSPKADGELKSAVKRSQIAKNIEEKFGVPIRRGKYRHAGAIGLYKPDVKVIRYKSGGLPTIFHETGHFLDDTIPGGMHSYFLGRGGSITERTALMQEYGYSYEGKPNLQAKEAFAEFVRFYYTDKAKAQRLAPEFFQLYEKKMAELPEIRDVMNQAAADYERWLELPSTAKVASQISFEPEAGRGKLLDTLQESAHRLYEMALDDLHPLKEFVDQAKKLGISFEAKDDPYVLARLTRGWVGKAETFLEKGTFGRKFWEVADGKVTMKLTGKSFSEIVKPLEEKNALGDFTVYLIARRAVELGGRSIKTGINPADAKLSVAELEKKYPEFTSKAKDLYKYQDDLLAFGKESGLYNEEALKTMRELNQNYVPFYRVFEELQQRGYLGRGFGNVSNQIKKIKGSDRDILNPLESVIKNTYAIINAAERNSVAMATMNLANKHHELGRLFEKVVQPMELVKVNVGDVIDKALGPFEKMALPAEAQSALDDISEDVVNIFRPAFFTKGNVITVLVEGKPQYFQVDPELYRAFQGLDTEQMALVWKILSYPAKFLRAGATLTPEFLFRNPARDQVSAFLYSKYGYKPFIDLARGVFSLFGSDDAYWLWRMGGGEHAAMVSLDREYLNKNLKDILKSKGAEALDYVKNPLKALQIISELGEAATRLGEMKKGLKKGADPIEAAFAAREVTLDFARIGSKTKAVNAIVAFWNAAVQGTDKMFRSVKDTPYKTIFRILTGVTLPSVMLYLAQRDDKRYKEIPRWQKDVFWIVLTKDHIYRIPKAFEVAIIFGSLPERILEYLDNKNPEAFNGIRQSIAQGVSPGFIPTFLLPWIENQANYSFFLDRSIVPDSKENLPPEAQFSDSTTELSKELGKWLQYSPAKIDNVIRAYFGGLGNYASQAVDEILKGTGVSNPVPRPESKLEDFPILKGFMIREPIGSNSESVNTFYNRADAADAAYQRYKALAEGGDKEEAVKWLAAHPESKMAPYYDAIRTQLSAIRAARNDILKSRSISPADKRAKVDKLDRLITDVAAKAITIKQK